jgi:presenilin-like A22 family membrane protease
MTANARAIAGATLAALLFLVVQVGALALVGPFEAAGYQQVEDPSDPTNSVLYVALILVVTALMLAAFRYDLDWIIRGVVVLTGGLLSWYVFSVVVPPVPVAGVNVLAPVLAAGVSVALLVYPEWYVVDVAGVVMGAGAAGLFGISFGLLPAIVLLVVLAVYDAISVYGTEHMLDLASGVMNLRVPVVLVVPLSLSYSLLEDDFSGVAAVDDGRAEGGEETPHDGEVAEDTDAPDDRAAASPEGTGAATAGGDEERAERPAGGRGRDAFFVGLGDAVMPTVMVASAAFFSAAPSLGVAALPALNLPALLAMVGTFLGLAVLLWAVFGGRPHAGLPLLNGGAVGGYLLGSVLAGVPLVEAVGLAPYL